MLAQQVVGFKPPFFLNTMQEMRKWTKSRYVAITYVCNGSIESMNVEKFSKSFHTKMAFDVDV
jgi:hypothetical protein